MNSKRKSGINERRRIKRSQEGMKKGRRKFKKDVENKGRKEDKKESGRKEEKKEGSPK